jgi:hypothetical protein
LEINPKNKMNMVLWEGLAKENRQLKCGRKEAKAFRQPLAILVEE